MKTFLLILIAVTAHADPIFESVSRQNAGWRISTRQRADERPITVCEKTLYDVLQGERIHIEGFGQVDAPGKGVGVNLQIAYCDNSSPSCNFTGRWREPSVHMWAAGNVSHDEEHHKVLRPSADYVALGHQQAVAFKLFVSVYGPRGRLATLDDCALTFARYR